MPILYEVPPELWINRLALAALAGGWSFPAEIDAKADVVVEKGGPVRRRPRRSRSPGRPEHRGRRGPGRSAWPGSASRPCSRRRSTDCVGVSRRPGSPRGKDFTTTYRNAQGDIATLNADLRRAERRRHRPGRQLLHTGVAGRRPEGGPEADRLRRRARPDRRGRGEVGFRPPAQRDRGLPRLALRRDGPDRPRGLAPRPAGRHPLHIPARSTRSSPGNSSSEQLKAAGPRAGEPAGQRPVRGQRRGPHPLPVGSRRALPDLGQPEQRLVPGDRPRVRDGEDAALHLLAVAW